MTVMRGADAITATLMAYGTDLVVGFIGHSTHEIADAIGRSDVKTINPATELGGAHILNGYNYVKGRPAGVGIWHTCGALLLPAALAEAAAGQIPVVHIALDVDSRLKDREPIQEIPWQSFEPMTRFTTRVERAEKLPEAVHNAFQAAQGVPPGPVFIDIPFDITIDEAEVIIPNGWRPVRQRGGAAEADVREAARLLVAAENPVFLVGGGVVLSEAGEELRALAELAGVPFVTTTTAQGVVSEDHPLSLGTAGFAGWQCANDTLAGADLVLVLGSRLADWGYAQGWQAELTATMVQVDTDVQRLGDFYATQLSIVADVKTFVLQLTDELPRTDGFSATPFAEKASVQRAQARKLQWRASIDARGDDDRFPMSPWRVMRDLREVLGPDDILVTDIGNHSSWLLAGTVLHKPRRVVLSAGAGVLGSGFPMGLGAKLAEPESLVVVGTGDGAFQYHLNELRVAIEHDLAIVIVVFNDGGYGANREMMTGAYGQSQWTEFENPDYVMIARAYGAEGERIDRTEDLPAALARAVAAGKPYIIDVPISIETGGPANNAVGPVLFPEARQATSGPYGVRRLGENDHVEP